MKYIKILLICFVLAQSFYIRPEYPFESQSDHVITFFIKNKKSGEVDPNIVLSAAYGGYLGTSNNEGQISLPRKTQENKFNILITPSADPTMPILNNVSHWQLPKENKYKMYQVQRSDDGKNAYWETSEANITDDRHVPLHTIIIFAQPNNVSMNLGKAPTSLSYQLMLPSVYTTPAAKQTKSSITLPNAKPFLGKLTTAYNLLPYGYATIVGR